MAEVVLQAYRQQVLFNETVTTSGQKVYDGFGAKELSLIVNVKGLVSGTLPALVFEIQEVDPGDKSTPVGNSTTGSVLTTTGTDVIPLPMMSSGTVRVSWTVTGAGATFLNVYASLVSKVAGTTALFDEEGNPSQGPAGEPGSAAVTIQGIAGGEPAPVDLVALATWKTSQVIVGLSAVQVTPSPLPGRRTVSLKSYNNSVAIIYIGNSSAVTAETGYPLGNGDTIDLDLDESATLWALGTVASSTLYVVEIA
jgi:hypothetical protein